PPERGPETTSAQPPLSVRNPSALKFLCNCDRIPASRLLSPVLLTTSIETPSRNAMSAGAGRRSDLIVSSIGVVAMPSTGRGGSFPPPPAPQKWAPGARGALGPLAGRGRATA